MRKIKSLILNILVTSVNIVPFGINPNSSQYVHKDYKTAVVMFGNSYEEQAALQTIDESKIDYTLIN